MQAVARPVASSLRLRTVATRDVGRNMFLFAEVEGAEGRDQLYKQPSE